MQTQLERNKQLVREHYEATVNKVDFDAIRRQLAPDFVDQESPSGTPAGPNWVIRHVEAFHAAFPDIHVELHELVAERDIVTVRATWSGTHRGPYMGFAPTNRTFHLRGMVMWRAKEGQIVERWGCLDRLGMMQQLGLAATTPKYDFERPATQETRA